MRYLRGADVRRVVIIVPGLAVLRSVQDAK